MARDIGIFSDYFYKLQGLLLTFSNEYYGLMLKYVFYLFRLIELANIIAQYAASSSDSIILLCFHYLLSTSSYALHSHLESFNKHQKRDASYAFIIND